MVFETVIDGEALMARGRPIWFQICGAADDKARQPNRFSFRKHSEETGPYNEADNWNGERKLNWIHRLVVG